MTPAGCGCRPAARPVARDEARSWLRRELLQPGVPRAEPGRAGSLTWLQRQLDKGIEAAADAPPLSTFAAMLVFLLLVGGLALAALPGPAHGPAGAPSDRRRAHRRGRHRRASCGPAPRPRWPRAGTTTPLVDGFRALAVRQVERGRLDDLPGATAHEVAAALAATYPEQRRARRRQRRALRRRPVRRPAGDPATRPRASWPSTTSWRCGDERDDHGAGARHRRRPGGGASAPRW